MIGLCLSLLLGIVRGACEPYNGKTDRYNGPSGDCVEITNCYFKDCKVTTALDKSGGAVKLSDGSATATVERCTFEDCSASSNSLVDDDMGGAVFVEIKKLTMSDCCGKGCWCKDIGQFLFIRKKSGLGVPTPGSTISQVTVLDSLYKNDKQSGTIYLNDGATTEEHINITNNYAQYGCGVRTSASQTLTKCDYLTVFNNTGNTVIYCQGNSLTYKNSNFVNNKAKCTIFLVENTVEVSNCLFRGNQGSDFGLPTGSSAAGSAKVTDCIFDYDLISTAYLILNGNKNNRKQTTIKICQFNTRLCPARLPCVFSAPFTASLTFAPSTKFSASSRFAASSVFTATQRFTETHSFTETSSFSETQDFSPSSEMTQSEDFYPSEYFFESSSPSTIGLSISVDTLLPVYPDTTSVVQDTTSAIRDRKSISARSLSDSHAHFHTATPSEKSSQINDRTSKDDSKSSSLSTGAIIGIVVGVVVLIVVIIIVIVVVVAKRRKDVGSTSTAAETNTATELDTENTTADTQWESITEINPMFADTMDVQMNEDIFDRNAGNFPE